MQNEGMRKRVRALISRLFVIALLSPITSLFPAPPPNITVHVIEEKTGKPLSHIRVDLFVGNYPGRKVLHETTDSWGTAYFYLVPPLQNGVSVFPFSVRYYETRSNPEITSLPQEVTIPVRRLSLMQSLQYIFAGN